MTGTLRDSGDHWWSIEGALSGLRPHLDERSAGRLDEVLDGYRGGAANAAKDLSTFCGVTGRRLAADAAENPVLRGLLARGLWWAMQHEYREGATARLSQRLAQAGGFLHAVDRDSRLEFLRVHADELGPMLDAAPAAFPVWLLGVLKDEPSPGLGRLADAARRAAAKGAGPVSSATSTGDAVVPEDVEQNGGSGTVAPTAPAADEPGPVTAPSPGAVVPTPVDLRDGGRHVIDAFERTYSEEEAAGAIEACFEFLDPKRADDNRTRLERAREGDRAALGGLAISATRSAAWRARNRPPDAADFPSADSLPAIATLAAVAAQFASRIATAEMLTEATTASLLVLLGRDVVGPAEATIMIENVAVARPEGEEVLRAGAAELVGLLSRPYGRRALRLDAEPWLDVLRRWIRYCAPGANDRIVEAFRAAGVSDLIRLNEILGEAAPAPEPDGDELFSPRDLERFEQHYQNGQIAPLAELLTELRGRLLAVLDQQLASEAHAEFRAPGGRVAVRDAGRDVFRDLATKARTGSATEAMEAHARFDRALASEKNDHARRTLAEWKAYALYRGSSILEAVPMWVEAVETGHATDEVLWNLAVHKLKQGAPDQAIVHLRPAIREHRLPLAFLRFAAALAVTALRRLEDAPDTPARSQAHETATSFLRDHARVLPLAALHLLWFQLAATSEDVSQDTLGRSLVTYQALRGAPTLPVPAEVHALPHDQRTAAIDGVERALNDLNDPCFHTTWRLWTREYVTLNPRWWPGVARWGNACARDGDLEAELGVYRDAAGDALRTLRRLSPGDERAKRVQFLRQAVQHLVRIARNADRTSLADEVRDRYVRPVPELCDPNDPKNRQLQAFLPLPVAEDGIWDTVQPLVADVSEIAELTDSIVIRLRAAIDGDPSLRGRHADLSSATVSMVAEVVELRQGVDAARIAATLLDVSQRAGELADAVTRRRVPALVPTTSMLHRVLKNLARASEAAPRPEVTFAVGWAGWPSRSETSSVPVEIAFPGPGTARDVIVSVRREGPGADVGRGHEPVILVGGAAPMALSIPITVPPGTGEWVAQIETRYTWGPLHGLVHTRSLPVAEFRFDAFLADRGIDAYEFPNPFVADVPLDATQVRSALFQGRDSQLDEVRATYGQGRIPAQPICFFGIRKTGKTSLLRRVLLELTAAGVVALDVNLLGLRAEKMTMDQLCLGLLHKTASAAVAAGADPEQLAVPAEHPNPILLVDVFFAALARQFVGRTVVVLLDEYQTLLHGSSGEPVLDALRPVHELGQVGFIAFSNQGMDPTHQTSSQLATRGLRVDFLRETDVARSIDGPLSVLGVHVHPSALHEVFVQTAGHPNFSARLARGVVERLNHDQRTVATVSDVRESAADILRSAGAFHVSWFSRGQNITAEEADVAIRLAKEDPTHEGFARTDARERLGLTGELARNLEGKRVIEASSVGSDAPLRIRGRLLWSYLRQQISVDPAAPPPAGSTEYVGLFVDLENIRPHKPAGMSYRSFAEALTRYAAGFGTVRSRWMVISSWNTGEDWDRVKAELHEAQFFVAKEPPTFSAPRRENKRDVADFVLSGQVMDEVAERGLTRVVIATGDGDLLVVVHQLLEKGVVVRVVSGDDRSRHLDYRVLARDRRAAAIASGLQAVDSDFDAVLLSEIGVEPTPSP